MRKAGLSVTRHHFDQPVICELRAAVRAEHQSGDRSENHRSDR